MASAATAAITSRAVVWPSARTVILAFASLLFLSLCALPTLYMLGISFIGADGSFSLINYRHLLTDLRQRDLLFTSTLLGVGSALLATIIGAPLGLLLARTGLRAKRLLRLALVVPLVIPPYILGLAWISIGGSARLVAQVFGRDLLSNWTYSLTGAVVVLGTSFYPLTMLATEAAARRIDAPLEEAALLVAGPYRVLSRITFALIAGIAVKLLIGNRMITTRRTVRMGLPLMLGRWRVLAIGAFGLVLLLSVILPLGVLAREVGSFARIMTSVAESGSAIRNSVMLSTVGATLIVALGVLLGYSRARARTRWRDLIDLAFLVTFAVPSTVVGIGLIRLWNRPGLPGDVYKSMAIIVIAYLARFVPVGALILAASLRQIPISFEEAADVGGASWLRTFSRIVLPQIRTGLAAAWVVAFIFAFGELGATVLVTPPGESTLPVRIYTMIANTPTSVVASLALMQAVIILVPLTLFGMLARNRRGRA